VASDRQQTLSNLWTFGDTPARGTTSRANVCHLGLARLACCHLLGLLTVTLILAVGFAAFSRWCFIHYNEEVL